MGIPLNDRDMCQNSLEEVIQTINTTAAGGTNTSSQQTNDDKQPCGICKKMVNKNLRYPNYICSDCQAESHPVTEDGVQVDFFNIDISGGFQSKREGASEYGHEHVCFIKNVRCVANEARFGGIVIQSQPLS